MAGERAIDQDQEWEAARPRGPVLLDRELSLTLPAGRWIAIVGAVVAAVLLRFPGLERWSLSGEEARTALAARDLIVGNDVPAHLFGRPFTVEWTALFMFLGAATDSVARMSMAVAGVLLVLLVLAASRWIGPAPAVSAATLIALSPTMIANARRVDGGVLISLLLLAVVACALAARDRPSPVWPGLLGAAAACLFLTGPIGVAALLLAAVAGVLILRPAGLPAVDSIVPAAVGGVASFVLVTTVFLTRPAGLLSAPAEILRQLGSVHIANAGDRFHVPFVNLIVNEQLVIVLAIVGLVASHQRALARALGIWTAVAFVLVSLLGDTGIAGHSFVVLPLALLAGLGVTHLLVRLPWPLIRRGPAAIYVGIILLLFLALLSLIGLLTPAAGLSGWDWLARLVLIALVIILPLAIGVSLLASRVRGHHGVLMLCAVLLVLAALAGRSAVLAATERPGEPMDPLAHGMLAESLPAIIARIERVSIDMTRTDRSPQDPTGGHGLVIAVDEEIEQPLRWYFRDFPNLTIVDPDAGELDGTAQVVFMGGERDASEAAPGMVGERYLYGHASPGLYSDPDWGRLARGLIDIREWRHFWGFLIERSEPDPEYAREFQLLLAPALAERLFGPAGPFALDDLAGAGTEGGQFNAPRGIAVAADGSVYVVDAGNQRIQEFDADGEFVTAFGEAGEGPGQLGRFATGQGGAGGIALSSDRIYVADTWNHRIQVFSLDGEHVTSWGGFFDAQDDPELSTTNPGNFYGPRGIAIHDGRVYVTDTGNERVQVFDLEGEFIQMWGRPGNDEGELLEPVGIAVDEEAVYVADSHNARIARYTHDGEVIDTWPVEAWSGLRFFEPYIALSQDGRLFATTSVTNEVLVFSEEGQGGEPLPAGDTLRPFGIATHPDGETALVTDGIRNGVVRMDIAAR